MTIATLMNVTEFEAFLAEADVSLRFAKMR